VPMVPWRALLTSPPVWAMVVTETCAIFDYYLIQMALLMYFTEVLSYNLESTGCVHLPPQVHVLVPTCSRLARRYTMPTIDTTVDSSVQPTVVAHTRAHLSSDLFVLSYCARYTPLLFITWYVNSWYAHVLKNNVTFPPVRAPHNTYSGLLTKWPRAAHVRAHTGARVRF
jgi:hypothetical protein